MRPGYGSGRLDHQFHSGHDDPLRRDSLRIGHLQNIGEIFLQNKKLVFPTQVRSPSQRVSGTWEVTRVPEVQPRFIGRPLGLDPTGKVIHSKARTGQKTTPSQRSQ